VEGDLEQRTWQCVGTNLSGFWIAKYRDMNNNYIIYEI
jgi:hypothetical protein